MMAHRRLWAPVLASFLLLSACSTGSLLRTIVPPETDRFARTFIEQLRRGDTTAVRSLSPRLAQDSASRDSLVALSRYFAPGVPDTMEVVSAQIQSGAGVTARAIGYQLHAPGGWTRVELLILADEQGYRYIDGVHVARMPASMQQMNAFVLRGKGPVQLLFLLLTLGVVTFSLFAAIRVARTPMPKRWWWAFVATLGAGKLVLNWTTGEIFSSPLSVQLLGAEIVRQGLAGPWLLAVSLPIGAIIALQRRREALASMQNRRAAAPSAAAPPARTGDDPSP